MRSTTALTTAAAALALFLAGVAPAGAQAQGTGDAGDPGGEAGGEAGGETGGTTGMQTTTPEAKSDDATGTGGTEVQPSPSATATEHGCAATERWDAQKMACVEQ
jgi:hypothetical protein